MDYFQWTLEVTLSHKNLARNMKFSIPDLPPRTFVLKEFPRIYIRKRSINRAIIKAYRQQSDIQDRSSEGAVEREL